ncbi:MBL fold metallo-hydrolase [Clostridium sp. MSJ-4]|uniref:MBL fold metallo-hydrolase n=1 Tax=Clostridium simiarum TaxID=2841506 RepID=A0ABS6F5G3_9CLOT|nr:MBL fold metallo-hydrolase [Clostridium simiarum]MBU5593508.1 MBL fold metallo-hydrolase [Clostridium simiarum]
MKIKQIRNATLLIEYAGKKFLVDPVLAEKGTYPPFPNSLRQDEFNPLVDLPMAVSELINVDAIIATHLHLDHFDDVAKERLPKNIKIYVQDEDDKKELLNSNFTNIEVLKENTIFSDIKIVKTDAQHGTGEILKVVGNVCGIIFQHPSEKTLYIAGDTVWYDGVQDAINKYLPEIIITNNGCNKFFGTNPLIMGTEDIYEVHKASPNSLIIASHMEAINHWTLSREDLRKFTVEKGFSSSVLIPEDGEEYIL